ncbi:unnamed protein product [Alternaria alternata]
MPIFSNNSDNILRKATANAIFDRGKQAYQSLSHVVFGDTSSPPTGFMEIENEAEHQEANTTLFASVSSPEENPNGQPESIAYMSISSTYPPESALRATSTPKIKGFQIRQACSTWATWPDIQQSDWVVIFVNHNVVASTIHKLKSFIQGDHVER